MAARRLLFAMLALLVISTIAAAFASREQRSRTDETTTTTTTTGGAGAGDATPPPRPLSVRIDVDSKDQPPRRIRVATGRPLSLDVSASATDLVSIPRLGLLEDVAPRSPAHFDLLIDERGNYRVRLVEANREVATIEVTPQAEPDPLGPRPTAAEGSGG